MTTRCRDVRELLDSYLSEELLVETNHDLLRHVEECADCQAELDARSRLRSRLKMAFERSNDLDPRAGFAAEVAEGLRDTPARSRPRYGWLAIAASFVIVAAAGWYLYIAPGAQNTARMAAGDHQNCAVKFNLREKPIPLADAAAIYDPAYARMEDTPPDQVPTPAGVLHVVDRHSCVFDSRRFGHVVLKLDDHIVSVLMTADAGAAPAAVGANALTWLPREDGLAMASMPLRDHIVYIVSDLPDAQFRQVAGELANPASRLAQVLGNIWSDSGVERE